MLSWVGDAGLDKMVMGGKDGAVSILAASVRRPRVKGAATDGNIVLCKGGFQERLHGLGWIFENNFSLLSTWKHLSRV